MALDFSKIKDKIPNPFRENVANWDIIQETPDTDTLKYRDVYEEQQLERSDMEKKQTPVSRIIATAAATLGVAIVVWLLISVIEAAIYFIPRMTGDGIAAIVTFGQHTSTAVGRSFGSFFGPDLVKVLITLFVSLIFFLIMHTFMMRNLMVQNQMNDPSDINQYKNDQHIALPEEIQQKFDYFPDVGAHSDVLVSSMISHMALKNKGLKMIDMVERHAEGDDDSEFYAILEDDTEDLDIVKKPIIDEEFQDALFEASGVPKSIRKAYDATKIPYNPGNKNRDKQQGYDSVADLINGDWDMPLYEPQRPGGAYIVDTDPVNTMVLAITRAGKGQTVIEPTIDMWLREKKPNNIIINDPKGELLVKNYVPAAVRGFLPVQFNLINAMKTDIYNPLIMAAQAARENNTTKCAMYVENIAEVFFPVDGGEDPVWPNAANNAFKRAAYGLIDYYLEEERELRKRAEIEHMKPEVLATKIDELWGKVTLYNCYQMFVQLSAKKMKNPALEFKKDVDAGKYSDITDEEYNKILTKVERKAALWDYQDEIDLLSLYFNATATLPKNSMRTLIANADNALRAMAGAEKMLASVYGIAITAMSFFTDPTISTLTSGTPSQNVDLAGLSFPRRIGVQFHSDFINRYHLKGMQCRWQAYEDIDFQKPYGPDFYHEDLVSREGWAMYYFKGIFPEMKAYLKLSIHNPQTGALIREFYFEFEKSYQRTLDGRYFVNDPVLDQKIIKDGIIRELCPAPVQADGSTPFIPGKMLYPTTRIAFKDGKLEKDDAKQPAIKSDLVRYCEKPKIVFLVTPPHLMKYAKLILILIKQLVDLNFDQSYMTKSNQKPLYKTRFMLDELGNLQSEGHGISGFETMLSIGLGQEQQFTLILQTLQQLRDVYGESVDKIVQGNAQTFDSLIATPTGWKRFGDIAVGDKVVTPNGKTTVVQGVFPRGTRPVYRVTRRDGSSVDVCNEHLWCVKID